MSELTLYNIDRITGDVKMEEIGFSHLFDDLVDHICCDVENQMQQGMSFEDAYEMVKANIGYRGLKKIQEDTLYMVDTKYRKMKTLMRVSGVAGTILLGFAAIFKISHLPMAGILLSLGAIILAFLFLPSALTVLWKETKSGKKLLLFISAFIAGVAFILGMLFKIQHWPGSAIMISLGMLTGILLFLPALLNQLFIDSSRKYKRPYYVAGAVCLIIYCTGFWFRIQHWPLAGILTISGAVLLMFIVFPLFTRVQWKNEKYVHARFIFMVITPLLFILPGALINLNLEKNYNDGFISRLEKQEDLIELQRTANNRYLELFNDSSVSGEMKIIHNATNELIETLYRTENIMVEISGGNTDLNYPVLTSLSASGLTAPVSYKILKDPFQTTPVSLILLPGCKARDIIEKKITVYKEILSQYAGNEWTYLPVLNPSDFLPETDDTANELAMITNMNGLLTMVSAVLAVESTALHKISSKR